jgi:hypothetical protein
MVYHILADIVVVVHLSFVMFVVVGGLLVLRWRPVVWVHIPAAVWGVLIEFGGWMCPLTPLEKWLRTLGGGVEYRSDFIQHYLLSVLYPDTLTRSVQIILGSIALAVNLLIYWRVFFHTRYTR